MEEKKQNNNILNSISFFTILISFFAIINFSQVYNFLNYIIIPTETTKMLCVALFTITIPIFTFSATLLGNAIEKSKEDKNKEQKELIEGKNKKIEEIRKELKNLPEGGDAYNKVKEKIDEQEKEKKIIDKKILEIEKKYSYFSLKYSVFYPDVFLLCAIGFNEFSFYFKSLNYFTALFFWFISLLCIGLSLFLICKCLKLIEEFSATSYDFQNKKATEAFYNALKKDKEINLKLKFFNIEFPYIGSVDKEIVIPFYIELKKGAVAKNITVYFDISDAFDTIPVRSGHFKQVVINVGTLTLNTCIERKLKIIPKKIGKYTIKYSVNAEEYCGNWEEIIEIVVN
jgi:hypothetical protein